MLDPEESIRIAHQLQNDEQPDVMNCSTEKTFPDMFKEEKENQFTIGSKWEGKTRIDPKRKTPGSKGDNN